MALPQELSNQPSLETGGVERRAPIRLIPRLDIKGPNLVKGIRLEGLRVLGKPERFARYYYEQDADELIYVDVVASLYGRNSLLDIVERTSKEIFIPLTVAGGLRNTEDIRTVLRAGADKVALNTAALQDPDLIRRSSKRFGSSTIVISIEAKKQPDGRYEAYTDNGRIKTGVDVFDWAMKAEALGAGEILLTSIDHEGTGNGFDIDLIRRISKSVSIPVIACGGAGNIAHIQTAIEEGSADAVSIASMLHYNYMRRHYTDDDYSTEGNVDFLRSGRCFSKVQETSLLDIKNDLANAGIFCRRTNEL